MLDAEALLLHAERLLIAAPDSADIRRSISASYYALFHLLTIEAAAQIGGDAGAGVNVLIRRSAQHREMRRVCESLSASGPAAPKSLHALLTIPLAPELVAVASTFIDLQNERMSADYDLDIDPNLNMAKTCGSLARSAFTRWARVRTDSNSKVFLAALLLADRWTRRG